ncbi:hypothetical protein CSHISOI_11029 [Colletotrichum shisoi]|uniref:Zn(2)-C6 fungal-type domain-containing protein n=1 Tax=Colletotrichum shisoi TaxID=2078593 RepID=A0A5Q4BCV9_9PEZI|nr:hypothetical protein CSHISOI_11029 [Colletotrichum shisoi]
MPGEDDECGLSANEETPSPNGDSLTRRRSLASSSRGPRSKRAKYAAAACHECKKRKLKCVKSDAEEECQRCISGGVRCIFGPAPPQEDNAGVRETTPRSRRKSRHGSQPRDDIRSELSMLREQVASLANTVGKLAANKSCQAPSASPGSQYHLTPHENASSQEAKEPKQPQFVGPTRSAFSLKVAETSLTKMGISVNDPAAETVNESLDPTRYPTPEQSEASQWAQGTDVLLTISLDEFVRLLEVFEEEVEIVYPFVDTCELISKSAAIRAYVEETPDFTAATASTAPSTGAEIKDVILARIAVAISMVVESHGKNPTSNGLVEPVKQLIYQFSIDADVDLKAVQIMAMISIYYFFSDEELLAWRNIGIAARGALEMGLHRKMSLDDNFPDPEKRGLASEDFRYLRCLIDYGRLCSEAWDALPPFGAPTQSIPKDTVAFLDFTAQRWLDSIPPDLQLRHPQHGGISTTQSRAVRRLRALLYLRGNHIRTMIHRHHVISSASIEADIEKARLVVGIAVDSISVLVHLSETSDIYERQQSAFNYFLLSALAVVFLAVCHGSRMFAEPCRESFLVAVELVKGFSRQGTSSRRLWKSIRGLLPLAQRIGLRDDVKPAQGADLNIRVPRHDPTDSSHVLDTVVEERPSGQPVVMGPDLSHLPPAQPMSLDADFETAAPDAFALSNDLMFLFDAFGQTDDAWANGMQEYTGGDEQQPPLPGEEEISRHFWGLI